MILTKNRANFFSVPDEGPFFTNLLTQYVELRTDLFTKNDATLFFSISLSVFFLQYLKVYPISLSFVYSAYLNFNPG